MKRIFIIFILIFFIFSYLYLKPYKIDVEYKGYIYSLDNDFSKKIDIQLKGDVQRYISGEKKFIGYLEIDGFKQEINKDEYKQFKGSSTIIKVNNDGNDIFAGSLFFSNDFKLIAGNLKKINKKYKTKCRFVAPVKSLEKAKKYYKEIIN
ncbi:MAG: hypothetical protein FH753_06855 [Firmicutes bacterium]|nr:hypothetical protein [Bacillota bacterium]